MNIVDLSKNKNDMEQYKDYQFMKEFIKNLTYFSLFLKKAGGEKKETVAEIFIKKMNNSLILRRKNPVKQGTEGEHELLIPFQLKKDNPEVLVVVGILNEEIMCFETHKRVPYRIVFECVRLF